MLTWLGHEIEDSPLALRDAVRAVWQRDHSFREDVLRRLALATERRHLGPRIAICGRSRTGKDTLAQIISEATGLERAKSSSTYIFEFARRLLLAASDRDLELFYAERRLLRTWWADLSDAIDAVVDPLAVAGLSLADGRIVAGLRRRSSLGLSEPLPLFDLVIWVDRRASQAPLEGDVRDTDCDIVIGNHGTIDELQGRVARLVRCARLI